MTRYIKITPEPFVGLKKNVHLFTLGIYQFNAGMKGKVRKEGRGKEKYLKEIEYASTNFFQ